MVPKPIDSAGNETRGEDKSYSPGQTAQNLSGRSTEGAGDARSGSALLKRFPTVLVSGCWSCFTEHARGPCLPRFPRIFTEVSLSSGTHPKRHTRKPPVSPRHTQVPAQARGESGVTLHPHCPAQPGLPSRRSRSTFRSLPGCSRVTSAPCKRETGSQQPNQPPLLPPVSPGATSPTPTLQCCGRRSHTSRFAGHRHPRRSPSEPARTSPFLSASRINAHPPDSFCTPALGWIRN